MPILETLRCPWDPAERHGSAVSTAAATASVERIARTGEVHEDVAGRSEELARQPGLADPRRAHDRHQALSAREQSPARPIDEPLGSGAVIDDRWTTWPSSARLLDPAPSRT